MIICLLSARFLWHHIKWIQLWLDIIRLLSILRSSSFSAFALILWKKCPSPCYCFPNSLCLIIKNIKWLLSVGSPLTTDPPNHMTLTANCLSTSLVGLVTWKCSAWNAHLASQTELSAVSCSHTGCHWNPFEGNLFSLCYIYLGLWVDPELPAHLYAAKLTLLLPVLFSNSSWVFVAKSSI